jgi:hypothetical protein
VAFPRDRHYPLSASQRVQSAVLNMWAHYIPTRFVSVPPQFHYSETAVSSEVPTVFWSRPGVLIVVFDSESVETER